MQLLRNNINFSYLLVADVDRQELEPVERVHLSLDGGDAVRDDGLVGKVAVASEGPDLVFSAGGAICGELHRLEEHVADFGDDHGQPLHAVVRVREHGGGQREGAVEFHLPADQGGTCRAGRICAFKYCYI